MPIFNFFAAIIFIPIWVIAMLLCRLAMGRVWTACIFMGVDLSPEEANDG